MDAKFYPAIAAIKTGDVEKLKELVAADPSLATSRSTVSHPTLLQCLVLDGKNKLNSREMAEVLIEAGADIDEPLGAAASIDNRQVAELLIDRGAAIDGTGGWSPLEEALYWNSQDVLALLLERGAKIQNLRVAAGLGRTDLIEGFFQRRRNVETGGRKDQLALGWSRQYRRFEPRRHWPEDTVRSGQRVVAGQARYYQQRFRLRLHARSH